MGKTTNLGLHTTATNETSKTFLKYRTELSGTGADSNMNIIDKAYGDMDDKIDAVNDTLDAKIDANKQAETDKFSTLDGTVSGIQSGLSQEVTARTSGDQLLQSQIDQIVAPSGTIDGASAAEVENARVGVDATTYASLGEAIRGQVGDLKSDLNDGIFRANYTWEIGRIVDGADGYNAKTYRTKGYYSTNDIDFIEILNSLDNAIIWYYTDNEGSYSGVRKSFAGATEPLQALDKTYPYYRLTFNMADFSALPNISDIVGYKYSDYRKITDASIKMLQPALYVSKFGYYKMDSSAFSRQRIALVSGVPGRYSASYRVSIKENLILDYDVLLRCNDPLFRIYGYQYYEDGWHYFDSMPTGIPVIKKGTEFLFTITRVTEDASETADIPMFVSKAEFLTEFVVGIEDLIEDLKNDIYRFNYPAIDILTANDDAVNKIWASRWLRSSTAKPLTLLWFSDIHRWKTPLERIIKFKKYLTSLEILDDTIVTGDLVRNSTDETSAFESFWNDTDGTDDILIALGNHDHYDVGTQPHGKASFSKMDGLFFQTVSDWGVVRESNYPFYYKDYEDQNIRLVVADPAVTSDEADETTWLQNTLSGAKTLGYSVVVACHFLNVDSATIYNNDWSNNLARIAESDSMSYDWNGCDIVSCVTDFINSGGKFICYMIGHTHTDIVSCVTNHPDQLIINVASASDDRGHETPLTTNDLPRYDNSRTQDCFNIITFDAENGIVKCVRVGANINMYQQPRTAFSYNVNTHEFINLI